MPRGALVCGNKGRLEIPTFINMIYRLLLKSKPRGALVGGYGNIAKILEYKITAIERKRAVKCEMF